MSSPALSTTILALADPTRRAILARLASGEATVNELAQPFTISQPAVSRHIKVLLDAGLIQQRVDGTRRPCRLATGALTELDDFVNLLRTALEQNYARLDDILDAQNEQKSQLKSQLKPQQKSKDKKKTEKKR